MKKISDIGIKTDVAREIISLVIRLANEISNVQVSDANQKMVVEWLIKNASKLRLSNIMNRPAELIKIEEPLRKFISTLILNIKPVAGETETLRKIEDLYNRDLYGQKTSSYSGNWYKIAKADDFFIDL